MTVREKIQSLLTAANETTGESDATLTDAVGTLCDGYSSTASVSWTPMTSSDNLTGTFQNVDELTAYDGGFVCTGRFPNLHGIKHLIVDQREREYAYMMFVGPYDESFIDMTDGPERITIVNSLHDCDTFTEMFATQNNLKIIDGAPLDLSSASDANMISNMFLYCTALEEVRFVPNSIRVSFDCFLSPYNNWKAISDDSLVSIANGLDASEMETLYMIGGETRLSSILGRVSDGLFVKDSTGTLTLRDFISGRSYKNWTLAV